jgi:hypothetical protein
LLGAENQALDDNGFEGGTRKYSISCAAQNQLNGSTGLQSNDRKEVVGARNFAPRSA